MATSELRSDQKRGVVITLAVVALFISAILTLFVMGLNKPIILSDEELKKQGTFLFNNPRAFKPFTLLDYHGKKFTPQALQGKWSLIFFGFTYCPDICPTTMTLLNRFYEDQKQGAYGDDLQIIMVSVDPGRDTPDKLLSYVRFFNQNFIGVTGEFLDLHRFATQLNIPFSKVPGGGENYTVEHSGSVAIINPQGHYVGFFRAPLNLPNLNMGYFSMRASRE